MERERADQSLRVFIKQNQGSQKQAARKLGKSPQALNYWLNHAKEVPLKQLLKIQALLEKSQGISQPATACCATNFSDPKGALTLSERGRAALTYEQALNRRQGERSDLKRRGFRRQLPRNFQEENVMVGETNTVVAKKFEFSSPDLYRFVKRVLLRGIPELIHAMDSDVLPPSLAAKIAKLSPENQAILLQKTKRDIRMTLEQWDRPYTQKRSMITMKHYTKLFSSIWIGETGKKIKKLGAEGWAVAFHLLTNPHTNMLGVYYLPLNFISHEVWIPIEVALKILNSFIEEGFCSYDFEHEYVWIHEMACYQMEAPLKPLDKRLKWVHETYSALPALSFLPEFYQHYYESLSLENIAPPQAPLEPHRSQITDNRNRIQKQKQKQTQKQKQKTETELVVATAESCANDLNLIFEHWKKTMGHPNARLDDKRSRLIQNSLKLGYSVEQLCAAITGCSYTPHNIGQNDRGQRYDGLHVILRDADQIDRFIQNCDKPPKLQNASDNLLSSNLAASQRWLAKTAAEENYASE